MLPLLLILAVTLNVRAAEHYSFQRLSLDDGLPQTTVHCMLQDRAGFVWLGTEDGLARYDGYSFVVYRHDPRNPSSLSNSLITTLLEDRDGTLWVGTRAGLNRLDRATGRCVRLVHDSSNPASLSGADVRTVYQDRRGTIWVGTHDGGLNRYEPRTATFTHFLIDKSLPKNAERNRVVALLEDSAGRFWVGTNMGGLELFDRDRGTFAVFHYDSSDPHSLSYDAVTSLFLDRQNRLWVTTYNGLNRVDIEHDHRVRCTRVDSTPSIVPRGMMMPYMSCVQLDDGRLCCATLDFGLALIDVSTGHTELILNDPLNSRSLSSNGVWTVMRDRAGALWVGTSGGAASRYDPSAVKFRHIHKIVDRKDGLIDNGVSALLPAPDGQLWIGTGYGVNRYDPASGKWIATIDYRNKLSSGVVMSLCEDARNDLWIGTWVGLNRVDHRTGRVKAFFTNPRDPRTISDNAIHAMARDSTGTLWLGTEGAGLCRVDDLEKALVTRFQHNVADTNSLVFNEILSMLCDHTGTIWIGTKRGLSGFDPQRGTWKTCRADPEDGRALNNEGIYALCETHDGVLWAGTAGGLNRRDPATGAWTAITERDGLPNNFISAIVEDTGGMLWLNTDNGLASYDPRTDRVRGFDVLDGVQSKEFTQAMCRLPDGTIAAGGVNGFNLFQPASMQFNRYQPPIVLTAVSIFNRTAPLDSIAPAGKPLHLTYRDQMVALDVAALNFTHPGKNRYAYRLEGFDTTWIQLGASRTITFTNLEGGEYVLHVRAANNDGLWNDAGLLLPIIVDPPWWKTTWFRLSALIVVIASAWTGYRARVRTLERQKETLEEQVLDRTKELQVEQEKSERLLLNILPESIAIRLKEREETIADSFQEATILFADIANFTVMSSHIAPQDIVHLLNRVFSRFDALTARFGLEKIKTIGDAYMVAAGIPVPRIDHVEAMADMALAMRDEIAILAVEETAPLAIRIGMHTGPVVAGVIGQMKFNYDLWGDTVNTASRMESHGVIGKIQVTEAVYERIRNEFVCEPRGEIEVKGKGMMRAYVLVGRKG